MSESDWNTTLWLVGLIASVIIGYWFFIRAQTWPVPRFGIETIELVGSDKKSLPNSISITSGGRQLARVSKSRVYFWNSGEGALRRQDIASTDRLRMELDATASFIEIEVRKISGTQTMVEAVFDPAKPNVCTFQFEYLNKGDGFVVDTYHDSQIAPIELGGTFIGKISKAKNMTKPADVPKYLKPIDAILEKFMGRKVPMWLIIVLGTISAAVGFFEHFGRPIVGPYTTFIKPISEPLSMVLFGIIYMTMGFAMLWFRRDRYPKSIRIEP